MRLLSEAQRHNFKNFDVICTRREAQWLDDEQERDTYTAFGGSDQAIAYFKGVGDGQFFVLGREKHNGMAGNIWHSPFLFLRFTLIVQYNLANSCTMVQSSEMCSEF